MKYIYELDENANLIVNSLGELMEQVGRTDCKLFDQSAVSNKIEEIQTDILQLGEDIYFFAKHFDNKSGLSFLSSLDACIQTLYEVSELCSKKIEEDTVRKIGDRIAWGFHLWVDKFLEHFEDWTHGLMENGLYLSAYIQLFDGDEGENAFCQMMKNALIAESLYFSLSRNKAYTTLVPIKEALISNRKTKAATQPIDAQEMSGRRLTSLQIASVEEDLNKADPSDLTSQSTIATALQWNKKGRVNWNREKVMRGYLPYQNGPRPLDINYQFQPVPGQLSNIHTSGIGRYGLGKSGATRNILTLFNVLTGSDPTKEKALAKCLLRYKRGEGSALGEDALKRAEMILPKSMPERRTIISQFNRAAYLICFQEVYRRKNQGYQEVENEPKKVLELPFGLAVSCSLKLLSDGHLTMKDVFNKNSLYGVFTGSHVMSVNLNETIEKFSVLFSFFVQKYACQDVCLNEWSEKIDESEGISITFTAQYFHYILKKTDGGEEDSEDEEYNIIDDESSNTKELTERISTLKIIPSVYKPRG